MAEQLQDSHPGSSRRLGNGLSLACEFFGAGHVLPEASDDRSVANGVTDQRLIGNPRPPLIAILQRDADVNLFTHRGHRSCLLSPATAQFPTSSIRSTHILTVSHDRNTKER